MSSTQCPSNIVKFERGLARKGRSAEVLPAEACPPAGATVCAVVLGPCPGPGCGAAPASGYAHFAAQSRDPHGAMFREAERTLYRAALRSDLNDINELLFNLKNGDVAAAARCAGLIAERAGALLVAFYG